MNFSTEQKIHSNNYAITEHPVAYILRMYIYFSLVVLPKNFTGADYLKVPRENIGQNRAVLSIYLKK